MPKLNEKVLAMVRREIQKDSNVTNKALIGMAKRIDRSVGRLGPRQFHAMYRLRATREAASAATPRKRTAGVAHRTRTTGVTKSAPARAAALDRDAVRAVLLELATEVAAATDKAAMIGVIGSLDRYVDRVVTAAF